jgi:CHAT domain-containing protein
MRIRFSAAVLALLATAAQAEPRTHALVVAVSEYPGLDRSLWLDAPRRDARLYVDFLRTRGIPATDIRVLADGSGLPDAQPPTREAIVRELERLGTEVASGDTVFLSFCGLGAQVPAVTSDAAEPDGLDEVLLPRDAAPWSAGAIPNAIRDDELVAAIARIRSRGAFVFAVLDAGFGESRPAGPDKRRHAPPAALGIPAKLVKPRVTSATDGAPPLEGLSADAKGGVVVFHAAGSGHTTPDAMAGGDDESYGTFSMTLYQVAYAQHDTPPLETYRQAIAEVARHYRESGVTATPLADGTALDLPLFGARDFAAYRKQADTLAARWRAQLDAGELRVGIKTLEDLTGLYARFGATGVHDATEALGDIFRQLGQFRRAISYYDRVVAQTSVEDGSTRWNVLVSRAQARIGLRELAPAIADLQLAIQEHEANDGGRWGLPRGILGDAQLAAGDVAAARATYQAGLAQCRPFRPDDPLCETMSREKLAGAAVAAGDLAGARALLLDALTLPAEEWNLFGMRLGYRGNLRSWWAAWADYCAAAGRGVEAVLFAKLVVNDILQLQPAGDGRGLDLVGAWLTAQRPEFERLAALLVAQGRLPELRDLLVAMREAEAARYLGRTAKTTLRYTSWEAPWAAQLVEQARQASVARQELARLSEVRKDEPQWHAKWDALGAFAPAARELLARIDASAAGAKPAASDRTVAPLPADEARWLFLQRRDSLLVLVQAGAQLQAHELPVGADELRARVDALQAAVRNPRRDPLPEAQRLYRALIAPVAADGKLPRTVYLSPDGVLRYLPFAALHDGAHWLVERTDFRYGGATATRAPSGLDVAGFGVSEGSAELSPLPAVPAELDAIVREKRKGDAGVMPGTVKLDAAFSPQQLQQALRAHPAVVHIASHFALVPGVSSLSYLLTGRGQALTLAQLQSGPYDFSRTLLVTLSACETGLAGRDGYGMELEGLADVVLSRGAANVMASLWPVADGSTARFMQLYYQAVGAGDAPGAALRRTQLAMLTDPGVGTPGGQRGVAVTGAAVAASQFASKFPYDHPFYWAPFVLRGREIR